MSYCLHDNGSTKETARTMFMSKIYNPYKHQKAGNLSIQRWYNILKLRSGRLYYHHLCNSCAYERFEEMFVSHVIGGGHVLEAHSTANSYFWAHTVVNIVHCHWNDFRYSKVPVYINSIRFIDDLRIWRCSISFAGKNNGHPLTHATSVRHEEILVMDLEAKVGQRAEQSTCDTKD